jgi:hypothetical protein
MADPVKGNMDKGNTVKGSTVKGNTVKGSMVKGNTMGLVLTNRIETMHNGL